MRLAVSMVALGLPDILPFSKDGIEAAIYVNWVSSILLKLS
jgi:hypothetical protein